jgi:hypothetical protein
VIVIRHDVNLYSRYAHVENMRVNKDDLVSRGQQIAQVGQDALGGPFHLHFDISLTDILKSNPGHWPGKDLAALELHYADPKDYIERHRPPHTEQPGSSRLPVPTQFGYVTAAVLNFRSEPSTARGEETVIAKLTLGTKVGIYSLLANGWYYVRVGNQDGFVYAEYISDLPIPGQLDPSSFQTGMNVNPDAEHSNPVAGDALKGLNWVRLVFKLSDRPNPAERGHLDKAFAQYDPIVHAYSQKGIKTLFIINQETHHGSPRDPNIHWPTFSQQFAGIAGKIAEHYQEFGEGVAYQIWNEGDLDASAFSIFLTPEAYAALLKPTAEAIRAASPQSPIIFGGLASGPDKGVNYIKRCREVLGGALPVDAIGIHPYGRWATQRPFEAWGFGTLANAFDFYKANLPGLKFWITEIGIAGDNEFSDIHYPAIGSYLVDVYKTMGEKYADLVPVLIWFAWSDHMHNAGIVKRNGEQKEHIFEAFQRVRTREVWA